MKSDLRTLSGTPASAGFAMAVIQRFGAQFARSACLSALAFLMLMHTGARAEVFYGVIDTGIYSVDTVAGGPATQVATFAPTIAFAATLATRPSDGMLFYLDSAAANPNLWRWDPANPGAAPVLVGTPGPTTTGVIRLGFDSGGNLYSMNSGAGSSLWRLDPATGAILSVTPASGFNGGNLPGGGDLCLHPNTGVLYMVAAQSLYTVTSTGVVTLLGAMTGLPGSATGCAFARDGSMVVSPGTTLYRVNIGTLVATAMTATGVAAFGDLATSPDRSADLRLTKITGNPTPGNTVSFTLTVTNDGPDRATDVRVLDVLPAGLTFVSATASQGSYSTAAVGVIPAGTWRVGTLNTGAATTLVLNVSVTGITPIVNTAQVSYVDQFDPDSVPNNSVASEDDQASVTITPSPDLRVVKTATSSFAVGSNATYSITVNNTLGSLGTGANTYTVTDVLPTGLTFVSAAGTGWTCAANTPAAGDNVPGGTRMVCTSSATMAAGAGNANAITLTVLPAAAAAPSVNNTATVTGGGEPASNNGNNSSTITTAVCAVSCPDLIVNKSSAASFTVGVAGSYTLSVSNVGGLTTGANTYTLTDTLPTGLTLTTASGGAGWTIGAGWACTGVLGGSVVSCNRSTAIAPGATSTTVVFPVTVANTVANCVATPATLCAVNTASVSGGGEPAAASANNTTSLTTPVLEFDLTVTKVKTTAANFVLGVNTATYTLTVNNIGGRATTGTYTVTDTLPAGLTLNAAPTATGWTCTANTPLAGDNVAGGGRVVCSRATVINAGAAAANTIVFPVRVAAAAAPSVNNTASISDPNESPNLTANNSSSVTSPVDAPDLVVTKSHNGNFTVGTNGVYALTVTNLGFLATSTAAVVVTDTLPAGLTFVSGTGTNWNACTAAGQVVTCSRPAGNVIAANSSAEPITLTVSVGAAAAAASPVINNISVAGGNEPAGNAANNSDADSTAVFFSPVITKSFSPTTIIAGGTSTLTLTISNPAGNTVSLAGVAVVDPFPPGMVVAATPALTNSCGGTLSSGGAQGDSLISLTGGVTGGAGTSCSITVNVTSTTTGANVNTTGAVSSTNSGTGNIATATLTVNAPAAPTLTMVSTPDPVGVNMPVTLIYTINNSNAATTNLGFTHNFPVVGGAQMVYQSTVSNSCTAGGASITNPAGGALVAGTSTGIRLFNGYDAAANAVCTIVVTVTVGAAGTVTTGNGTPGISGLTGSTVLVSNVNDTFNVRAAALTKAFSPATVATNISSQLTFTLTNGTGNPAQGAAAPVNVLIGFTETLPAGLVVASTAASPQCNGTVTGAAGSGTITFSGGILSLGQATCAISVNVSSATPGVYNNLQANVSGVSLNLVNNASATLTVTGLMPSLTLLKFANVISDPFNNGVNPKAIPGAILSYTVRLTNSGPGTVDANTVVISDPLPATVDLFVGNLAGPGSGPVAFSDGTPASGMGWTFTSLGSTADSVDFSQDGIVWTYTPVPDANGFDATVRHIRLKPTGIMSAAGVGNPSLDLLFRVRIR